MRSCHIVICDSELYVNEPGQTQYLAIHVRLYVSRTPQRYFEKGTQPLISVTLLTHGSIRMTASKCSCDLQGIIRRMHPVHTHCLVERGAGPQVDAVATPMEGRPKPEINPLHI
jgi:hypothetical protein